MRITMGHTLEEWRPGVRLAQQIALLFALLAASCAGPRQPAGPQAPTAAIGSTPAPQQTTAPTQAHTPTPTASPAATATHTAVPQPLIPTVRSSRTATAGSPQTPRQTPSPAATATARAQEESRSNSGTDRKRICVGVPEGEMTNYDWGAATPGSYVNWRLVPNPPDAGGSRLIQMVRTWGGGVYPEPDAIRAAAKKNPGSLWLIGNEPDVVAQDNATPEQYANAYGIAYRAVKEVDPTAQVAIAGVAQPTPLRLAYLDRVLEAYRRQYGEEMPVDVWNVHAYILREEEDSWGVGIPPGMEGAQGKLFDIDQHNNMTIFRQQIADFRRWMADHGQRDKPLIVSEFGLLMPEDYGFPPEVVSGFLIDTFDFFLEARDGKTGYPADDDRMVQIFCWFSATMPEYPTSDLFDPVTREFTPVGEVYRAYVEALK